jgi:hypothetical protein
MLLLNYFRSILLILHFYPGSLSVSFLSGKIMFRGVHYVTVDYMMYIQDGCITFAYWKPQFVTEKNKKERLNINSNKDKVLADSSDKS